MTRLLAIYVGLLFFLFVTEGLSGEPFNQGRCPRECECSKIMVKRSVHSENHDGGKSSGGVRVNCAGRGLVRLPAAIPLDVEVLDLRRNLLQTIEVGILSELPSLQTLFLTDNRIERLDEVGFFGQILLGEVNF